MRPCCGWRGFLPALLAFFLLHHSIPVAAQRHKTPPSPWQTLTGSEPVVAAKGGFSGIFPDSSQYAYSLAMQTSLPDVVQWCDVQLTKDGFGVCLPDMKLDNCTGVGHVYGDSPKNSGWFSVDFTLDQLSKVPLVQGVFTRTDKFDGMLSILSLDDFLLLKPSHVWLNIQNNLVYNQHNLSMTKYISSISKNVNIDYISSPEVAFLSSIAPGFRKSKTKFIFRFLGEDMTEPSTKETYGSLLKNLKYIKSFASGILIPKNYIWPVTADSYLKPHTSVVSDAHMIGLEVFASDFANDALIPYNYSYDPIAEYLSYIDNGDFSVDGVLSDHPITASEAIGCYSHLNKSSSVIGKPVVISHNGASGTYPACTDLAYKQAINDGADYIDCPVQVTKDGELVCLSSINLLDSTTVTNSSFGTRFSTIPQIQSGPGIYTFNLTWEDIQKNLMPLISSPPQYSKYNLPRNPAYKNAGKFMSLSDFLALAKGAPLSGVLISIEHAAFLAESLGLSITDSVLKALSDAGYNNITGQEVLLQSSNSSVLISIKQQAKYKLVYKVDELISGALSSSIQDIKKFADAVVVEKKSIFPSTEAFITQETGLVGKLQSAGFPVYVYLLMNEFVSQPWDFFGDPHVEVNNYYQGASVDGVITDYPATTSSYRRNTCLKGNKSPDYMLPVQPAGLLSLMAADVLPPAQAPYPSLTESDVVEPPLPPAVKPSDTTAGPSAENTTSSNEQPCMAASIIVSSAMILVSLLTVIM